MSKWKHSQRNSPTSLLSCVCLVDFCLLAHPSDERCQTEVTAGIKNKREKHNYECFLLGQNKTKQTFEVKDPKLFAVDVCSEETGVFLQPRSCRWCLVTTTWWQWWQGQSAMSTRTVTLPPAPRTALSCCGSSMQRHRLLWVTTGVSGIFFSFSRLFLYIWITSHMHFVLWMTCDDAFFLLCWYEHLHF